MSEFSNLKYMKNNSTTLSFVQPIAAHDFTIYLFDTFEESWCVEHYSLWYTAQS